MFFWENGEEKKAEENASKRNDYKDAKRAWETKEQIKLFTHGILRNRFITATVSHTFFEGLLKASILVQRHDQTKRIRKATAVYHFMGHTVTVIVCVVVKSGFEPIQGLWSTPLGFRYQGLPVGRKYKKSSQEQKVVSFEWRYDWLRLRCAKRRGS
jgi:hypothetical protein